MTQYVDKFKMSSGIYPLKIVRAVNLLKKINKKLMQPLHALIKN